MRWTRPRFLPRVEELEDRTAPATLTVPAGDVTTLIQDINTANGNGQGSNIIELAAGATYTLAAPDNYWYGPDGLPAISSNLTIEGNGATLRRDPTLRTPFRLFYVSGGLSGLSAGDLTLHNLTLQDGLARGGNGFGLGGGGAGMGGAIFNQGTLNLNGVTLFGNTAQGGAGGTNTSLGGGGGGIGSDGVGFSADDTFGGGFGGTFPGGSGGLA
jgi:hypothetical protein